MQTNLKTKVYLTGNETDAVVINFTKTGYSVAHPKKALKNYTITTYGNWRKVNAKTSALVINGELKHDYWYQDSKGDYYYIDELGIYTTGWKKISNTWYYFDPGSGIMLSDTCRVISGKNTCFNKSGSCISGC